MKTSAAGFILAMLVALQAHAANGNGGAPVITFTPTTVQVSGVTPGGTVVIYGVAMSRTNYTNSLLHFQAALIYHDHDGVVTYEPKQQIPYIRVSIDVYTNNRPI